MMASTKTRRAGRRRGAKQDEAIAAPASLSFLTGAAEPVKEALAGSVELKEFLKTAGTLTLKDRRLIVDQALILFEENFVHLPLKMAMYAVNPVQRLRLLRTRLERQTKETMDPELAFHGELSAIFHSVHDLHTNYLLPAPYAGKIAYLPFLIEEYQDATGPHFVVSHLVKGFSAPGFAPGAEITHWSGIPIKRAVDLNGERFAGSNPAARHSRGVESLTMRALTIHLPPEEEWVTISYLGVDEKARELTLRWLVVDNPPPVAGKTNGISASAAAMGVDLGTDELTRAKRMLFAPEAAEMERVVQTTGHLPAAASDDDVPSSLPQVFRARRQKTPSGTFGHIRIFTFYVEDADAFVAEFVRLIGLLPQNGLIVDVRGNGGGNIYASEFALQTLTPRRISPEPVQFISSNVNLKICRKHRDNPAGIDLGPWYPSLDQATEIGSSFSNAFPITPVVGANAIGQKYCGPVLLITDARCYSATDIFAAGFQDHEIGKVLGVDANTGAGGANVWDHALLKQLLEIPTVDRTSPYEDLPQGAGMRVAIRRTVRVGELSGTPVEDLGVTPDIRYGLTRDDVLKGNVDLLNRAGEILAKMTVHELSATAKVGANGDLVVKLKFANLDRADIAVDDRPRATVDLTGTTATVTIPQVPNAKTVRIAAYDEGTLAAATTVAL
jgi:hypothetical protein